MTGGSQGRAFLPTFQPTTQGVSLWKENLVTKLRHIYARYDQKLPSEAELTICGIMTSCQKGLGDRKDMR
jgi:hypothetical protein